jgi:alpha-glucosidase
MTNGTAWWQDAVIYQILVRSFQDSNGDGQGDLPGILQRMDHLEWLGVDAIWLTPIFPSPLCDGGYDIEDFDGIHPMYGTLDDFRALVDALHGRGIRLILDWVPNHTSSRHPWFQESRSSRESAKRDWYTWADPGPDGGPPNNWLSVFGGSAWTHDEATGQYYYHAFLPEQPDLNWRNEQVREAMLANLRRWFERGVDGVRIDAVDMMVEDEQLTPNPVNPDFDPANDAPDRAVEHEHTRDRPEVHEHMAAIRAVADAFGDRVLIGELYIPIDRLVTYYGSVERGELHLPLNLGMLWADWDADGLNEAIEQYLAAVPDHAWPAWSLGNHDRSRLASRVSPEQARVATLMLLTLRGTPTLYYGDEIGMTDVPIPPERQQDPQGRRHADRNRDVARTPLQWSAAPYAGFSTVEPWLPVPAELDGRTVDAQRNDPHSLLTLHRRLICVRRETVALRRGSQIQIERSAPCVAWIREHERDRLLVLLNISGEPFDFDFSQHAQGATIVLSTFLDRHDEVEGSVQVRGNEGLLLRLI